MCLYHDWTKNPVSVGDEFFTTSHIPHRRVSTTSLTQIFLVDFPLEWKLFSWRR
jgi:hypothetical protein